MGSIPQHSRFPRAEYDPWFKHIDPPARYSKPSVTAFHVFSLFGFVTCLMLTATILLSKRIVRHKSVPNFFAFLVVSSFMVSITWFTGNVDIWETIETNNPPSFKLCAAQACGIAGLSTGQGMAACFLVFQVWLAISRTVFSSKSASYLNFLESDWGQWILFAAPWTAWLSYAIATLIVGVLDPSTIRPNSLYCATTKKQLVAARHYSSAFFAVLVVLLQLHLAYMSGRQYLRSKRRRRETAVNIVANNEHGISIDLEGLEELLQPTRRDIGPFVVRVLAFGLYTCFLVVTTIYIAMHPGAGKTAFADTANASIAPLAFITFGSQADCLQVWWTTVKSAFTKVKDLSRRTLRRARRVRADAHLDDPLPVLQVKRPIYAESEKLSENSKNAAWSASSDSTATTKSADSLKPQLPVLLDDQYRTTASAVRKSKDLEEGRDSVDFFAALNLPQ